MNIQSPIAAIPTGERPGSRKVYQAGVLHPCISVPFREWPCIRRPASRR